MPFTIKEVELRDGVAIRLPRGREVLAESVHHRHSIMGKAISPAPALGYRIRFQGKAVEITGDSAWCQALEELVTEVELALIEAGLEETGKNRKGCI